jgi:signal transduction histidine kinase
MRIATRLLLVLVPSMILMMGVYAVIALQQRAELISDALIRETDTLARALQAVTNNAIRDGRYLDLDGILEGVAGDPETFLVVILEPHGAIMSGELEALPECLAFAGSASPGPTGARGWAECDGRVRWVHLPVREPAEALLVARRATVVEQDEAASRVRISLTTLALGGGAALVILFVLRGTLSRPLERIMDGVREVGGPAVPDPIHLPRSAGELRDLADAFNQMAHRLEGKRMSLVKEVGERMALEGRIRTEEKFAALGRLTGGLAHELGTPLNVIGVRAEAILDRTDLPADARRQAREIVAEVDRVAELVRSLIHMARRDRLERVPFDLRLLVREVADAGAELAAGAGIRPEVQVPQEPVMVDGDRNLLRHALMNLVTNSVQALASDPDRSDGATVVLRVEPADREVLVFVDDDGPGVSPGDLPHLFEPFFSTKDVGEGMGLGLAITRGIVQEHGGRIELLPRSPRGLRVILVLPTGTEPT